MKIAKVIELCNDCEHCTIADNRKENKSSFAICMFPDNEPFLVGNSQTGDVLHYQINFPKNCPLEDYTGTQNQL